MMGFFLGLLMCVIISGAAFLAMGVRRIIPAHHMSSDTKDVVKITMGMVATMTALILGLLVSSARDKYETEQKAMIEVSAKLAYIDGILAGYGPETKPARTSLRNAVEFSIAHYWPETQSQPAQLVPERYSAATVYFAVQQLSPQNEVQRALKQLVLEKMYEIGQTRWLISKQADPSFSVPLLVFVVCWLAILFFSFGLFAPNNGTVIICLIVGAIAVSSAVFLILELDQPFSGLIKISSQPMLDTLKLMGN